jgi:hypothetical protein
LGSPRGVQDTYQAFEDELKERGRQGLKERRKFTFS